MPIRNGGAFFVLLCFDRTIGLLQDVVHAKLTNYCTLLLAKFEVHTYTQMRTKHR